MVQDQAPGEPTHNQHHPLNFIYSHLHNSIRSELNALNQIVLALEPATSEHELMGRLVGLKEQYRFLESVYKYHSSVEDEVCGISSVAPLLRVCSMTPTHACQARVAHNTCPSLASMAHPGCASHWQSCALSGGS